MPDYQGLMLGMIPASQGGVVARFQYSIFARFDNFLRRHALNTYKRNTVVMLISVHSNKSELFVLPAQNNTDGSTSLSLLRTDPSMGVAEKQQNSAVHDFSPTAIEPTLETKVSTSMAYGCRLYAVSTSKERLELAHARCNSVPASQMSLNNANDTTLNTSRVEATCAVGEFNL